MPIVSDGEFAKKRNEVKDLERRLYSLSSEKRDHLFALQNACFRYLERLPPARQKLLVENGE
jgi:hypothetical protein